MTHRAGYRNRNAAWALGQIQGRTYEQVYEVVQTWMRNLRNGADEYRDLLIGLVRVGILKMRCLRDRNPENWSRYTVARRELSGYYHFASVPLEENTDG